MTLECSRCGGNHMRSECPTLGISTPEPDWKFACLMSLKLLHQTLDLIEEIDNELILHGRLKDLADAVLAARPPR